MEWGCGECDDDEEECECFHGEIVDGYRISSTVWIGECEAEIAGQVLHGLCQVGAEKCDLCFEARGRKLPPHHAV